MQPRHAIALLALLGALLPSSVSAQATLQPHFAESLNTAGTGTRFLNLFAPIGGWSATEAFAAGNIPFDLTMCNLRVALTAAPGTTSTAQFTVRQAGADTALLVSFGSGDTTAAPDTDCVSFTAGQKVAMELTVASANMAAGQIKWSFETRATTGSSTFYHQYTDSAGGGADFCNIAGHPADGCSTTLNSSNHSASLMAVAGTFTGTRSDSQVVPGVGDSWVIRLTKNGVLQDGGGGTVDTTCTITAAVTTCSASYTLTAVPGDYIGYGVTFGGSPSASALYHNFIFTPTTTGQSMLSVSSSASASGTVDSFGCATGWGTTAASQLCTKPVSTFRLGTIYSILSASNDGRTVQSRDNASSVGSLATYGGGGVTATGTSATHTLTSASTFWGIITAGNQVRPTRAAVLIIDPLAGGFNPYMYMLPGATQCEP